MAKDYEIMWLVWNPEKSFPTTKHFSLISAKQESERLAKAHHGNTFYVMAAVGFSIVEKPKIYQTINQDGIPF